MEIKLRHAGLQSIISLYFFLRKLKECKQLKQEFSQALVAHIHNPSYLGDTEDQGLMPAWENSL
jgi:hypothetical protein